MELSAIKNSYIGFLKTACVDRVELSQIIGETCIKHRRTKVSEPLVIFSSNGQAVSVSNRDEVVRTAMKKADIIHADGQSVVFMSKIIGEHKIPERTATTDLIHDVPKNYPPKLRHYFLGGELDVVSRAARLYQATYNNVEVAGYCDGYFSDSEVDEICERINALDIDVLWVGLGKPKEQIFCIQSKSRLNVGVIASCGGCFNFITGDYKRSPVWMQHAGLEWLHRLCLNPKKLFLRYLITNPHSVFCMMKGGFSNVIKNGYEDFSHKPDVKKVAVFMHDFRGGGAEKIATSLANGLCRLGWRVSVLVLSKEGPMRDLLDKNIEVVELKSNRMLLSIFELAKHLHKHRYDCVISHMTHANVVATISSLLTRQSKNLIVVEHNQISKNIKVVKKFSVKLAYYLTPMLYRFPSRVVPVSEGVAKDLVNFTNLPRSKFYTIYNPVVSSDMLNNTPVKSCVHPFFDGKSFVFLGVGSLSKQKGFSYFIEAVAILRKQFDVKAIILGEGPERDSLEELRGELELNEIISLPGFVNNVSDYMNSADVFVLSSLWEGLPTVLIEALANGMQIVSTDCESGPSEILEQGKFGYLAELQSSDSLAEKMEIALVDKKLVSKLKSRAEDFSISKSVGKYANLVENL